MSSLLGFVFSSGKKNKLLPLSQEQAATLRTAIRVLREWLVHVYPGYKLEGRARSLPRARREDQLLPPRTMPLCRPKVPILREVETLRPTGRGASLGAAQPPWPDFLHPAPPITPRCCRGKEEASGMGHWGAGPCRGTSKGGQPRFLTIASMPITSSHLRGREEAWEGGC